MAQGDERLKGRKHGWLRRHADMRRSEAASFRELHKADLKTSRARHLKETFGGLGDYSCAGAAEKFSKERHGRAIRSQLEPLKAVARMLKSHPPGLLNYLSQRITHAMSEGFNSLIQNIQANAPGLPNFASFRILFHRAKLDMTPA
jgi:transposase